ncbi:hypothetical protein [Demequina zhanjiangensis]|uniref:DUF3558 domain-containing protein n=1 Tax=Demequina zhanjiangensis TaxID=3051659 RepID=A0ABT8G1L3_9MICO|nr:hypothetical protein [Demequina sp. SYSU T00b26]MDN4472983.1 hypothetical protein [Demequina sp. SYSU T00b26]
MPSRLTLGAAALIGTSALLLTACSSTEDPSAEPEYTVEDAAAEATRGADEVSPDLPNPCELIDAAALESTLGVSFGEGAFNGYLSNEEESICEWNGTGESYASVQVAVRIFSGSEDEEIARAVTVYGDLSQAELEGIESGYAAPDGTIVGALTADGIAVYVLHYTEAWTDLTESTAAVAALVVSAL